MRLNFHLVRSTLVGALGGLLFGFDTAVIAGTTHQLTQVFQLSAGALGLTVSIALWGTVAGAIGAGPLGQKDRRPRSAPHHGRACICCPRWVARLPGTGLPSSSSASSAAWASAARLCSCPVYLAELAPARLRGRLVGLFQINIVAGILLAYASNYGVAQLVGGSAAWRWQFGVAAIPALLFAALPLRHPAQLALAGHAESHSPKPAPCSR